MQTQKELIVRMGTFGIYQKPRKVRISHISNGKPSVPEFDQMNLNFKMAIPSKPDIVKKQQFIQNLLKGSLSSHQLEELSWRNLEDKISKGKLHQLNVPYEVERLRAEIENFETKIGRALTMNMKAVNADPAINQFKMR